MKFQCVISHGWDIFRLTLIRCCLSVVFCYKSWNTSAECDFHLQNRFISTDTSIIVIMKLQNSLILLTQLLFSVRASAQGACGRGDLQQFTLNTLTRGSSPIQTGTIARIDNGQVGFYPQNVPALAAFFYKGKIWRLSQANRDFLEVGYVRPRPVKGAKIYTIDGYTFKFAEHPPADAVFPEFRVQCDSGPKPYLALPNPISHPESYGPAFSACQVENSPPGSAQTYNVSSLHISTTIFFSKS
jgi:hypothetical protein